MQEIYYISFVESVGIVLPSFLSFEYLFKCYFGPNQRENQLAYKLYKDDNKQVVLEIYLLNPV